MWHADIAPVKLARNVGRATALVAVEWGTSSSFQGPEDSVLLVYLHHRCGVLLTRISESGWHELDDRYIYECNGFPLEWRGIIPCMAGHVVCDLHAGGAEPLVHDPSDSD